MSFKSFLLSAGLPILGLAAFLIGAIIFGGPKTPRPLNHIAERFDTLDMSDLPAIKTYSARDGVWLAYRVYEGAPDEVILALHGSGGAGRALHLLAKELSENATVIVPDIRGHGDSGRRGDVDYAGQVDDDLGDLRAMIASQYPGARLTLIGFSMGGGLALRHAAQNSPDRLVLLSPYLAHDAPPMVAENPYAPASPWAEPGVGRIIGLSILNSFGLTAFDHLPVVRLATRAEDAANVASHYTHRMLNSVNPSDWKADLAALEVTPVLFVGRKDELHLATAYDDAAPSADVRIIDDVDHMGLTLDAAALQFIAKELSE